MGSPSVVRQPILDWLRTPGPDGQLAEWRVSELAVGIGCPWTTVAQQIERLVEDGEVERAGRDYAPRGRQPRLYRATERTLADQIAEALRVKHEDCDCAECRPWTG